MALLLSEDDVSTVLTMDAALESVEEAFRALGAGEAQNQPRRRVRIRGGMLHNMSASLPSRKALGIKAYASVRGTTRFLIAVWDTDNGDLKALIEGDRLGQIRTGAASGIATKYLANEDASVLGMIGTGWQARSQVEAICAVRPLQQVRVFGRDPERRQVFAEEIQRVTAVETVAVESGEAAVRDADVIATMTSSAEPVLLGEWMRPGVHVNAAGSNATNRQEIDVEAVRRAGLVVVDNLEGAKLEAGDLTAAVEAGALAWDQVVELGAIVTGQQPGRADRQQITLFESQGLAVQDMAAAAFVYEQARERGLGQEVPFLSRTGH
jgi:ornithine cyclodeaminase